MIVSRKYTRKERRRQHSNNQFLGAVAHHTFTKTACGDSSTSRLQLRELRRTTLDEKLLLTEAKEMSNPTKASKPLLDGKIIAKRYLVK